MLSPGLVAIAWTLLSAILLAPRVASADVMNNEATHAHVDAVASRLDGAGFVVATVTGTAIAGGCVRIDLGTGELQGWDYPR